MANQEHLDILKQGVDIWNEWRKEHPDLRPDLSASNLTKGHFMRANLSRVNLNGAVLSWSSLSGADLSEAILIRADLMRADLSGAILCKTDLNWADLSEADLSGADLSGANLGWAYIQSASLIGADLSASNLIRADLGKANLKGARLRGADLSGAYLRGTNLSGANLTEAALRADHLRAADLSGVTLIRANLSGTDLSGANLSGAALTGANLSGANLSGANLSRSNLRNADLSGADLTDADLTDADLIGANLIGAILIGAHFGGMNVLGQRQTEPIPISKPLSSEHILFTSFYPSNIKVEKENTLLVYTYVQSALQAIHTDANSFENKKENRLDEINAKSSELFTRGTDITIVPQCQGIVFKPEFISFKWMEDWHRAIFNFSAPKELSGSEANGEIIIYAGPLIIAALRITLRFKKLNFSRSERNNHVEVTTYSYKRIFASYSHADTPVVLACRNVYKALGFDVLIDIDLLRSGEIFDKALMRMIDSSDIFQLFWSSQSALSKFVRKEWRYALRHNKGEGFIRPVYWEQPLVQPPKELAKFHFTYLPVSTLELMR